MSVPALVVLRGAECKGHTLRPVAKPGWGVLNREDDGKPGQHPVFHLCAQHARCAAGDARCDCLGGSHDTSATLTDANAPIVHVLSRCGDGFVQGSALCSLCEPGRGKRDGNCSKCSFAPSFYWIATLLYVLLWFPLLREVTTKYTRSLYTTIAFLQFLGIFSRFDIDWTRASR